MFVQGPNRIFRAVWYGQNAVKDRILNGSNWDFLKTPLPRQKIGASVGWLEATSCLYD